MSFITDGIARYKAWQEKRDSEEIERLVKKTSKLNEWTAKRELLVKAQEDAITAEEKSYAVTKRANEVRTRKRKLRQQQGDLLGRLGL